MARNFLKPKKKTVHILAYFFYIPFSNAILHFTQIVPSLVLSAGSYKLPLSPFVHVCFLFFLWGKQVCTFMLVGVLRKNSNSIAQIKSLIDKALPSEQLLKLEGSKKSCPCCLGWRLPDPISSFLLILSHPPWHLQEPFLSPLKQIIILWYPCKLSQASAFSTCPNSSRLI